MFAARYSLLHAFAFAATTSIVATAAHAATVSADIDFTGNGYAWAPSFSEGALTIGVTGHNYTALTDPGDLGTPVSLTQQIGVSINTNGLGACSAATSPTDTNCGARPQLDGQSAPELLKFSFDREVTITGILFSNNDQNDAVDYFLQLAGASDFNFVDSTTTPAPPNRANLSAFGPVTMLGIGNQTPSDQYRIERISVSYEVSQIPLPAAAWMLIAGMGGLGLMARRKKSS